MNTDAAKMNLENRHNPRNKNEALAFDLHSKAVTIQQFSALPKESDQREAIEPLLHALVSTWRYMGYKI